ncbi:MAG: patatin-like phospholipase family protein, partial [Tepidiformaceae bacterium]
TESEFTRTFGDDYLRAVKLSTQFGGAPALADIERFARQWKQLVPHDPDLRAAIVTALRVRYGATPQTAPMALDSAGYTDPDVREAYLRMYAKPLDDAAFAQAQPSVAPAVRAYAPQDPALADAEAALEWLSVPAGTVLIAEGESPDYLYFVVSGRFRVTAGSGPNARFIADVGRGELIGEMGVLTGEPRTANVVAMRDSEIVRLPQAEVLRLTYESPRMLLRINQVLARRLRMELAQAPRVPSPRMTIAVVGLTPATQVKELSLALVRELERLGPVAHISKERAEREFPRLSDGSDPALDGELLSWLSEQEARHYFVVYEAVPEPGAWTDLCLRQADRMALVAPPGAAPGLTGMDARMQQLNAIARVELVLLHGSTTERPRDTRAWLSGRNLAAHHHVVVSDRALVARFARRLSGNAVGLVLGGGGARGYFHIGAWRALEEAGLPVDIIGGTSVGALMAAGMATGRSPDQMEQLGSIFAEAKLKDLTLPLVSFFRSREISRLLRTHTEGVRIEDLWRPYFCVSTSLGRAEPVVHTRGPLWMAARASSAIPGLFSPVPTAAGDLLVDGGVMNNVPVDVMRGLCERGPVIAINLSAKPEKSGRYGFGASISGWQVLASRLNPFATTVQAPSIFTTLLRTTEAGSIHRTRTTAVLSMADLLVTPPVDQFRLLDFGSRDELIKLGYEWTSAALTEWLENNAPIKSRFCTP